MPHTDTAFAQGAIRHGFASLAFMAAIASPALGQNLLFNGGAESETLTPWVKAPANAPIASVTQQTQTLQIVTPFAGMRFFTFAAAPQAGTIAMVQSGMMPVEPPAGFNALRLSGVYQTEFEDTAVATITLRNGQGDVVAEAMSCPMTNSDQTWSPFALQVELVPDATTWEVRIEGTLLTGTFINVFLDEMALEPSCVGDLNADEEIDGADLGLLLAAWGACPGASDPCDALGCSADLNVDDTVDGADLGLLLAAWGGCG
jgi:hypothetical protein